MYHSQIGKRGKIGSFLSLGITMFIVLMLFFAGSASAVKVNLQADKPLYKDDSLFVTITASVDIEKNEAVPIRSLRLIINDGFLVCDFDIDGTNSCDNIEITPLSIGQSITGDLNGDGFGYTGTNNPKNIETNFGYGYGINNEPGVNGELKYLISWDIVSAQVPNGKYEARLEAYASNGDKEFTYISKNTDKFQIQLTDFEKAKLLSRVKATSSEGNIESINIYNNFASQRLTYQMDLRKAERYNSVFVEGKLSLYMHGEMADKTTTTLDLNLDDYELITFNDQIIELNAKADYTYKKTNSKNSKNNEFSKGTEDVYIIIENGIASMSSNGAVPFYATVNINLEKEY